MSTIGKSTRKMLSLFPTKKLTYLKEIPQNALQISQVPEIWVAFSHQINCRKIYQVVKVKHPRKPSETKIYILGYSDMQAEEIAERLLK